MTALKFEGDGWEYFKIWIVNILLTIVTLGLYYPWAKVRNLRYFYANSTLEGKNFEYHATGKQLFIGYLIAMILLIAYVTIEQFSVVGSLIVLLIFALGYPWIVWRSLKFNARMTSFSNVRFSFSGGCGAAYVNFLLLPAVFFISIYAGPVLAAVVIPMLTDSGTEFGALYILAAVLIGCILLVVAFFMYAFLKKRISTYIVKGYQYGQGEFDTNLETSSFALILLKTIAISFGIGVIGMLLIGVVSMGTTGLSGIVSMQEGLENSSEDMDAYAGTILAMILPVYVLMLFGFLVVSAYAKSRQRAYIYSNSLLDEKIAFESTLRARSLAWVMISNLFLIVLTLGLATPWAKVRLTRLYLENTQVSAEQSFDEYVTQKLEEQSSLGEQIGDAFDVDMDFGI